MQVGDLQSGVSIIGDSILGTLNKVKFDAFSGDPEEQEGHYLALDMKSDNGTTIKTKVKNGRHDELKEVDDGYCIYFITDPKKQGIIVEYTKGLHTETKEYDLSSVVLA